MQRIISDSVRATTVIEFYKDMIDEMFYKHHEDSFEKWANKFKPPKKKSDFLVRFFKCSGISDRNTKKWKAWTPEKLLPNSDNEDKGTIRSDNKRIFENFFNIKEDFWLAKFTSTDDIRNNLNTHLKKDIKSDNNQSKLHTFLNKKHEYKLSLEEEELYILLKNQDNIAAKEIHLEERSPHFLFLLAKLYKNKNQPRECINTLEYLNNLNTNYKRTKENYLKINKIIAECHSHKDVNDWDKAIDILLHLYELYEYQEPEIMTLLGANHKRKALFDSNTNQWCDKKDIDFNTLYYSIRMYENALENKKEEQYYEAINLMYYGNIFKEIEDELFIHEDIDDDEIEEKTFDNALEILKTYEFNENISWEIFTKAEYHIFIGEVDYAINLLEDFFSKESTQPFEFTTLTRQLEMYTHFVKDKNFIKVLNHLNTIKNDVVFI